MANDDRFPVPAYSAVGYVILAVAFVWALTVRIGARLYALALLWVGGGK